ncbi:hypothetical protein FVE85_7357 [Porphyridium purpureum]|uniref:Sulfotransferase domain-containing protein n=1 Tax=Porphyridium purpureum TaxID=35688 RepID=A0A5J4Z9M2_PORPP|nr:hypothetical protein FVE85_7357 [Porphyridium purpureum]|eukprot:POR5061..scf295_1
MIRTDMHGSRDAPTLKVRVRVNRSHTQLTRSRVLWVCLLAGICVAVLVVVRNNGISLQRNRGPNAGTRVLVDDAIGWSPARDESERAFWRDRRLYFVVSPGRAGTKFMSNVFNCALNVRSFHEIEPKMNNETLHAVLLGGRREASFAARAAVKVSAIEEALLGSSPEIGYAETSHMFVKTFADVVLERLVREGDANVTIILLRRRMEDIVRSQAQLGWFLPGHSGRDNWYYSPREVHVSEQVLPGLVEQTQKGPHRRPTQLDHLLEYNMDVIQRGELLRAQVEADQELQDRVRFVRLDLEQLSDTGTTQQFLEQELGLQVDPARLSHLFLSDSNKRELQKERRHLGSGSELSDEAIAAALSDLSHLLHPGEPA